MKIIRLIFLITLLSGGSWGEQMCTLWIDKYDRASLMSRDFLYGKDNRWPNGRVPYMVDNAFNQNDKQRILDAINYLNENTCASFVQRANEENYLIIIQVESQCRANVGYNKNRRISVLELGQNTFCMSFSTIVHELLHILGMVHEHTRPDRDDFVEIMWDNVYAPWARNWYRSASPKESPLPPLCNPSGPKEALNRCYSGSRVDTFGLPYDFFSILHYGLYAGSSNSQMVIRPKNNIEGIQNIGRAQRPSSIDLKKIMKAYPCVNLCSKTTSNEACIFPFTYNGKVYNECTTVANNGVAWCPTTTYKSGDAKDYGSCDSSCANTSVTSPASKCRTKNGLICMSKYTYKGVLYNSANGICTMADSEEAWCALTVYENTLAAKEFGFCKEACKVAQNLADGCSTRSSKRCIFPFVYKGVTHSGCTSEDHTEPWCATSFHNGTKFVNGWGNCDSAKC